MQKLQLHTSIIEACCIHCLSLLKLCLVHWSHSLQVDTMMQKCQAFYCHWFAFTLNIAVLGYADDFQQENVSLQGWLDLPTMEDKQTRQSYVCFTDILLHLQLFYYIGLTEVHYLWPTEFMFFSSTVSGAETIRAIYATGLSTGQPILSKKL